MTRSPDERHPATPRHPRTPGPGGDPATDPLPAGPEHPAAPPCGTPADAGDPAATTEDFTATGADRLLAALRADGDAPPPADPGSGTKPPAGRDELALRRLLHDAVRGIEPRPGTLDRLHRAVPARRARRRQAMVGAAAGMLLVGTAVPAVLHAARPLTDTTGNINASGRLAPGDRAARHDDGPAGPSAVPSGRAPGATPGGPHASASAGLPDTAGTTAGSAPLSATPPCSRTQLGSGTARVGNADADGRVYGSFRVVNVSGTSCAVTGPSEISVTAQGATDPAHIQVVDHTAGDPAALLPDPDQEPSAVILPPGQAYQVQFAWIPASGGGTSGCAATTGPTPPGDSGTGGTADGGTTADGSTSNAPAASASAVSAAPMDDTDTGTGADSGDTGTTPGPGDGEGDGGTASSPPPAAGDGIALTNTPPEGGPAVASADISGACAGTVYRTDPMPTP